MFIFAFVVCAFDVTSKNSFPRSMSRGFYHMFSSKSFVVSGLTIQSLIHFELTLVCSIRWGFNFILLNLVFQDHLLKRATLSSSCIVVKDQLIYMHGFISRLSILFCVCLFASSILFALHCNMFCITALYGSFVIHFEIRKCVASSFVLLAQNDFGYSESFVVSYGF